MKLFLKIAIIVLAVLVAGVGAVTGWYFYMQTAPVRADETAVTVQDGAAAGAETLADDTPSLEENTDEPYILKIPVGTGIHAVAAELEENGLIRSADIFYLKARLEKFEMKAGRYTVRPTMSMSEIFALLASGKQDHISVSIPEGLTTSQIAQLLVDSDVILSKEEFIKETKNQEILEKYKIAASSLEGYLFPDTYFFNPSIPKANIFRGVGATRKSSGVTSLTFLSVAWADKITATANVNSFTEYNSDRIFIFNVFGTFSK